MESAIQIVDGNVDEVAFYELVDALFKVELDMNWFVVDLRTITHGRWNNFLDDLETVRGTDWPTKREIYVCETGREIKALLIGSS